MDEQLKFGYVIGAIIVLLLSCSGCSVFSPEGFRVFLPEKNRAPSSARESEARRFPGQWPQGRVFRDYYGVAGTELRLDSGAWGEHRGWYYAPKIWHDPSIDE